MDNKKFDNKNYQKNHKNYRKINNKNKNIIKKMNIFHNNLKKYKYNSMTLYDSPKYKKKYEFLMKNLSFNGNNSNSSFKNISNNNLDDIFKNKPFLSFDATHIKVVDKIPKKYTIFFNNINAQKTSEKDEEKKSNISLKSNIKSNRIIDDNRNNSKELRNKNKPEYYNNFQHIKKKLIKVNEANDKIMKDIQREQSLRKHNIQVAIVKFNQYKLKFKRLKKHDDFIH